MNYSDVLSFWFEEINQVKWWIKDEEFDRQLQDMFLTLHQQANKCELWQWRKTSKGRLAEIIVLDQFSRNIFRDTPQAFSSDPLALALAQEAVLQGEDRELSPIQRTFLYMPYMHSESLKIHDEAVKLYEQNGIASNLDFEIKHRDIISEFGRYPHRNAILGRESTAEEIEFLKLPGSGF